MRAVVVTSSGGPEVLGVKEVEDPAVGQGDVLIRVIAAGLNRADTLQRKGFHPAPLGASSYPGLECSGVVEAVGRASTDGRLAIRSPWSNKYCPPLEDGPLPSDELRTLEVEANDIFSVYCEQYYEGGVSSVYIWEDDSESIIACFLIKKDGSSAAHGRRGYLQEGAWDAIHVIEVKPEEEGIACYCLTSTVMLSMTTESKSSGSFNLSGSIRRQMNLTLPLTDGHISNMGKMIEEMESKLRNSLEQVYFGKTREMVCTLRPPSEGIQVRLPEN